MRVRLKGSIAIARHFCTAPFPSFDHRGRAKDHRIGEANDLTLRVLVSSFAGSEAQSLLCQEGGSSLRFGRHHCSSAGRSSFIETLPISAPGSYDTR
jgi:hypothetical protein